MFDPNAMEMQKIIQDLKAIFFKHLRCRYWSATEPARFNKNIRSFAL